MTKHLPKIIVVIGAFLLFGILLMKVVEVKKLKAPAPKSISLNQVPLSVKISLDDGVVYSISKNPYVTPRNPYTPFTGRLDLETNQFYVSFCVSNPISTRCNVVASSDGYYAEWQTDNTNVMIWGWVCQANYPTPQQLDSTNVYAAKLPIKTCPNTKPGSVSFRMCFKPGTKSEVETLFIGKKFLDRFAEGEYWSNEITITVVP